MATLTYSQLKNLAFDRAQVNVSTDAPVSDTEFARFINEAIADIYNVSGGRSKRAASATLWDNAQVATGTVFGVLTSVEDILHLYATTTAPASISITTNSTTAITSSAAFGPVVAGMEVSGPGITAGTLVSSVATTSAATLTQAATTSATSARTFSPTIGAIELDRVELSEIQALRADGQGLPTYVAPKKYALVRQDSNTVVANVNMLRLEYWPSATGYYFPAEYVPQFTEIDSVTVTTPELNDLESRDAGLICAARIAQMVGRNELVQGILADVSTRTQELLARKLNALMDAKQDVA